MEFEQTEQPEQSANNVEVAEPQQTEVQDTSVNTSEVAEPNTVQDAETNAQYAEVRRNQELNDYRTKISTYEQNLNRVAQLSGYQSHDDLLAALDEIEQQQERERYEQAGIDPDQFQQLVSELPEIKQFREIQKQQEETQKFESEVSELFSEFPDLKPEQIPPEAWQLKESKGLSLLDSYLRVSYKSLGQQKEQEAIQKLQGNAQSSPGPLGGGDVNHNTNISTLSSKDFGSIVDQVLRGERKTL
jgi:hypothetical protein